MEEEEEEQRHGSADMLYRLFLGGWTTADLHQMSGFLVPLVFGSIIALHWAASVKSALIGQCSSTALLQREDP